MECFGDFTQLFLSEVGKFGDVFIVCVDVWIVDDVDVEVEVVSCGVWI